MRNRYPLLAAVLLAGSLCLTPVCGAPVTLGVNAPNLGWQPADQARKTLKDIASSGVKAVRLTFRPPFDKDLAVLAMAKADGLQIALTISLNSKDYYSAGARSQGGIHRLSDIDEERFESAIAQAWQQIEAQKIVLTAVEIGNEINWASFNGDLQPASSADGNTYDDTAALPEAADFKKGLDKYVDLVRFVKRLRDASTLNRKTLILTAGLARIPSSLAAKRHEDAVSAAATLQSLHALGIDALVDAHAIHYYPNVRANVAERVAEAESAVKECHAGDPSKPCWMTEWGVNNNDASCPIDDSARKQIIVDTHRAFAKSVSEDQLSALFYFEWDGKTPRSIWRCGALTDAGRAALMPF